MPSAPRPSTPAPTAPRRPNVGVLERPTAAAAVGSFGSGDPQRLLDLRHDPGFGFEEFLVHLAPAAERFDREEAWRGGEGARAGDPRDHGPVTLLDPDRLASGGEQV